MNRMTGAQIIIHMLERQGIRTVAGIPGGANLPLYDALSRSPAIHHVLARHEQGAAFMAQGMARLLKRQGHRLVEEPRRADVLIVNTCGFIEDAREESIGELRALADRKRSGQLLIAAGCLSQFWGEALVDAVPGLDALLGTHRWNEILALIEDLHRDPAAEPRHYLLTELAHVWLRRGGFAYVLESR